MPRTPPTIVAPLPTDPRVMSLAKSVSLERREAFAAAAEAWAWMSVMAVDDIVVNTAPESLDGLVDVPGFGAAMLQVGLVGVVNDGLVLPAELRHHERGERGGTAAVPAAAADEDEQTSRRREQNAAASRRYRKRNRATGSKPKPSGEQKWRSLGRVAGHEVRVFDGPHGCYAMVLGATVGMEPFRKLTTGDKAWSLESVRLVDTLPGLLEKWRVVHQKENGRLAPQPLVPSYADFRDDAERLTELAKLSAADARHADGADASSRHADASASSAGPSAGPDADGERKSYDGIGLDASSASADRHADAFSSMSSLSESSSSHEEEDKSGEGRRADGIHEPDQGDAEPDERQKRERWSRLVARFAQALGRDEDTIRSWWRYNRDFLRAELLKRGIDPNTGLIVNAEGAHEPRGARDDIGVTTEPIDQDKPAASSVGARGGDEFACAAEDIRRGLQQLGIPSPATPAPLAEDDAFERQRADIVNRLVAGV